MEQDMVLRICHLYPDLLNLYGDRGNLIALKQRCLWRGIDCRISQISLGQPFQADEYDMVFIGGGQDHEQNLLYDDLLNQKGDDIRKAVEDDLVFLCICGGYQLMGHYYEEQNGRRIEGLGALDLHTVGHEQRLIGNLVCESGFLAEQGLDPVLVGFENHSGRTWLGPAVKPLAKVISGNGNNSTDGTEGAIYRQVYCTYMHGSFLPKNPVMADHLALMALQRRYDALTNLPIISDEYEENARRYIQTCK